MGLPWTARLRRIEERAAAALPQTTDVALFRIVGGKVRILAITGEVTTAIQNQANNTKLKFNPAGVGSDVDLCAVLSVANDAVGTLYTITGDFSDAMQESVWAAETDKTMEPGGVILGPGDIELDCAASNTGAVKWTVEWEPVDGAGHLTAV
jgi:hypothetical protein